MNYRKNFKLTSPFGITAQIWLALFPGSLHGQTSLLSILGFTSPSCIGTKTYDFSRVS
jgi:hypothetical protein